MLRKWKRGETMVPKRLIGKRVSVVFNCEKTSMEGKLVNANDTGIELDAKDFVAFKRFIPYTAICYIEG